MVKTLFRCEHCYSYYEYKSRARGCHISLGGKVSKFVGLLERKYDRQNK